MNEFNAEEKLDEFFLRRLDEFVRDERLDESVFEKRLDESDQEET
jgi:hypothetical protein